MSGNKYRERIFDFDSSKFFVLEVEIDEVNG